MAASSKKVKKAAEEPIIVKGRSGPILPTLTIEIDNQNCAWSINVDAVDGKITLTRTVDLTEVKLINFKGKGGGKPDNPHKPDKDNEVQIIYS